MNKIIYECNDFMKKVNFQYAICGGYALELFLNTTLRSHSDIDICVFDENKPEVIKYMQSKNWNMYELLLDYGLVRAISNHGEQKVSGICVFAIKPNCSLVQMKSENNNLYKMEILNSEQLNFDFVEIIFNAQKNGEFICAQDNEITRKLDKAILYNGDIPYIAPELILFFKSNHAYALREGYQKDFDITMPHLPYESRCWLIDALEKTYPEGHEWIRQLKDFC